MPPPLFNELGKPCSDVFNRGYPIGQVKVDAGVRTCGNVNLNVGGAINTTDWSMDSAAIDCKFNVQPPQYKTTVGESWDLDNKLRLGVTVDDLAGLLPGCRLNVSGALDPATGKCSTRVSPQMRTNNASMEVSAEVGDDVTATLSGSIVGGCHGWLAGVKGNFNAGESKVDSNILAIGYCSPTFQYNGFVDNLEKVRVSAYHRINDRLEAGFMAGYKPPNSSTSGEGEAKSESMNEFAIGGRFLLSRSTSLRAKINGECQLGLGMETKLGEEAVLTLAAQIDGKSINGGNHKLGLGLELTGNFSANSI